ncbi:LOW QUALITY PROTEIN: hypothetical protein HZS_6454 [Henneguya salminicola]|nr:LOW QUALITY PROTEIN: hypothetical protein HZS_6454 [Henneguya salminicola]
MNGLSDSSLYEKPIMAPLSLICGMKTENIIEPIINLCDNYLTQDLAHTFNQQQNIDCENVTQIQLEIDKLIYFAHIEKACLK